MINKQKFNHLHELNKFVSDNKIKREDVINVQVHTGLFTFDEDSFTLFYWFL